MLNLALFCLLLAILLTAKPVAARTILPLPHSQFQAQNADAQHLYLLPAGATTIALQTHIAELAIDELASGNIEVRVNALYRLKNAGAALADLSLRVTTGRTGALSSARDVALSAGSTRLSLDEAANGDLLANTEILADSQQDLTLSYTVNLDNDILPAVKYNAATLKAWPGPVSLSVQMRLPESVVPESQLLIAPQDWSFAPVAGVTTPRIKWLFDGRIPAEPFVVQFVTPVVWRKIAETARALDENPTPALFLQLGDLHAALSDAARQENGDASERFYAQALAAYIGGLDATDEAGTPSPQTASLHRGLARLYRNQVAEADALAAPSYGQLMVDHAAAATPYFPEGSAERQELERWQGEGLRLMLATASAAQAWQQALALVDRLAQLPAGIVDPEVLADQRREIIVQQALQLLEQDQRAAALAVAGAELTDSALLPPENTRSLFASWSVTAALDLEKISLVLTGSTFSDRHAQAEAQLAKIVADWESAPPSTEQRAYSVEMSETLPQDGRDGNLSLAIDFPIEATGLALAKMLPEQADWALLRALLLQLSPQRAESGGAIWRDVTLTQPLDLGAAGDQWEAMAINLERQAETYAAGTTSGSDAAASEALLSAKVKAVNYRAAAHEWRSLAGNSTILTSLSASRSSLPAQGEGDVRTWLSTVTTPSQVLELQTQTLSAGRLLLVGLALLAGLFLMASLLWRLI